MIIPGSHVEGSQLDSASESRPAIGMAVLPHPARLLFSSLSLARRTPACAASAVLSPRAPTHTRRTMSTSTHPSLSLVSTPSKHVAFGLATFAWSAGDAHTYDFSRRTRCGRPVHPGRPCRQPPFPLRIARPQSRYGQDGELPFTTRAPARIRQADTGHRLRAVSRSRRSRRSRT